VLGLDLADGYALVGGMVAELNPLCWRYLQLAMQGGSLRISPCSWGWVATISHLAVAPVAAAAAAHVT
jgi:hypothetical protein